MTFEEDFYVPEEVYGHFNQAVKSRLEKEQEWNELFAAYKEKYPELAEQLSLGMKGELPKDWDQEVPVYEKAAALLPAHLQVRC